MKLAYWITPALKTLETKVTHIKKFDDGRVAVLLAETIFYAQGGGQPGDRGKIMRAESKNQKAELNAEFSMQDAAFLVEDVRHMEGDICHYGRFVGEELKVGEVVCLTIDWERRWLNTRLHSAAHLLDAVMKQSYPEFQPMKSYHFPEGPYVEYRCTREEDTEKMKHQILLGLMNYENNAVPVSTDISNLERRIVMIESSNPHAIPCGGTHVNHTAEIGPIVVRKIKIRNGVCRISYSLH